MSPPVSNLALLLRTMQPVPNPGCYAFCTLPPGAGLGGVRPLGSFQEREGLTVIVEESHAVAAGWPVLLRAAWITLNVHSDLGAVGFTAAFSAALGEAGISCNVVAAACHDHVFVPVEQGPAALEALCGLQRRAEKGLVADGAGQPAAAVPAPAVHAPAPVRLHAPGLLLRLFEPADAEAFTAAVRESAGTVGRWMGWCTPDYTLQQAHEWFGVCARAWADGSACEFGIFTEDGAEFLGGAGLNLINRQHNHCNLGYWVRESRQRQGIASRVVAPLAEHGLKTLGFTRIEIVVAEGNEPSHGVARKSGAVFEALAQNRLVVGGVPVAASVFSVLPQRVSSG